MWIQVCYLIICSVTINWKLKNGEIKSTVAPIGITLLDLAHKFDIDLEGACAGQHWCNIAMHNI